jgi:hypothetical protein
MSRKPTPLAHVVADYEAGVTEVDAAHIEDFLVNADPAGATRLSEASPEDREALMTLLLKRSIHVHCWDEPEFSSLLCYAIEHLGQTWELVHAVFTDHGGSAPFEFGYVLRRSDAVSSPAQARQRFSDDLERLRRMRCAEVIAHKDAEIARLRAELGAVYATKLFRYSAPLREVYARVKGQQKRS